MTTTPQRFKTPRQRARESAFQILFKIADPTQENTGLSGKIETEIDAELEHFETPASARDFAKRLVMESLSHQTEVDQMIAKHLKNWRPERVAYVEKTLLRLGTSELLYFKDVPAKVTLDEVIELARDYGSDQDAPSFINGVLDAVAKEPQAVAGKVPSSV